MDSSVSKNDILISFDEYWLIREDIPTYDLFLGDLETKGKAFLGQNKRIALKNLANVYREFEAKRWSTGKEKYHTHGIYSAWIALDIISRYRKKLEVTLKAEGILEKATCVSVFGDEEVYSHIFYSMLISAILHDIDGSKEKEEVSASPDERAVKTFVQNMHMIEDKCMKEIVRLTRLTDYKEKNPIFFDRKGGVKFIPQDVPTQALIIVISDLLQIGAVDYFERLKTELELPTETFPPNILLLVGKLLKEFSSRLRIEKPVDVIPFEIRDRVLSIFKNSEKYDWKWPPRDYTSGGLLVGSDDNVEWKKEFFHNYLLTLLGIET